jgi:hypothetical protein
LRARFTLSTPQEALQETLETGKSREVGFRRIAGTIYIVAKRTDLRQAFLGALAAVASAHILACRWISRIG